MLKKKGFLLALFFLFVAATVNAQVTTATLGGEVVGEDKLPLPDATVVAVHEPSGTRYGAVANADGRYTIQGMRAGLIKSQFHISVWNRTK